MSVNYDSGVPGWSLPRKYVYELYKDKNYNKQEYYKSGGRTVLETLRKRFGLKDYLSPTEMILIRNSSSSSMRSIVVRFLRFLVNYFSLLILDIVVKREVFLLNMPIYTKLMKSFISLKMSILSEL